MFVWTGHRRTPARPGLAWPWLGKLPIGRLPGDIVVERENFRFYLPLTSMLLASLLISVILWLFRR
ncbi:MAG: DUF2905 domain-containing protein [Candidatus Thiodiazotropha sp.]